MRPGGRDSDSNSKGKDLCNGSIDASWETTHDMMGRENNEMSSMIEGAATVKINTGYDQKLDRINVEVVVTNEKAGHKFPTDSPMRHLILIVEAIDGQGNPLPQVYGKNNDNDEGKRLGNQRQGGETIPLWIGEWWNPFENFAGYPGKVFANILMDQSSGSFPSVSYWNRTKPAWNDADTRLLPMTVNKNGKAVPKPDRSTYYFASPMKCDVMVTAKLWYRYAFKGLAAQKNWVQNDILVADDEERACGP